jgi:mycothione reductase
MRPFYGSHGGRSQAAVRHDEQVTHYDVAIIGAGSGNTIIDERYAHLSVAIIEKGLFGGTCMNVGCIPTKMFVYPADIARDAVHGPALGVDTSFEKAHWPEIRDRIFGRIDPIPVAGKAYRIGLPNVTVYDEECTFIGERTIDTGSRGAISADQIVIAAGSRATVPDIPGLSEVEHHTSDTIMRLPDLPRRIAILGGGFIAAEFAHVFSAYGVEVTQICRGPVLLRREDEEVAARFTEIAQEQWDVRLNTLIDRVDQGATGIRLQLTDSTIVEADVLLVATGRVPNSDLLDLTRTGVETDADGVIKVDKFQRTTADGIWALGDIANHHQLKHVANHEARVIQHNLLHPDDLVANNRTFVPAAVFTSPQIASVGLTEQYARAQGLDYVTAVQQYGDVAYGWAMEDTRHFVKLIADPSTGLLLGAHLIGPQASVLIQVLIQAMSLGQTVDEVARGQYWIHPALAEVVENALLKVHLR